jgi:hypothetical protein
MTYSPPLKVLNSEIVEFYNSNLAWPNGFGHNQSMEKKEDSALRILSLLKSPTNDDEKTEANRRCMVPMPAQCRGTL